MKRAEVTEKILTAKRLKELTWEEIAKKIGGASKIIVTAACMGQMKMTKEQATKAAKLFGLGKEETLLLQEVPYRGSLPQVPPTDPLIYRFYELVAVYGTTWKELIQEEFGDGIMSAIDFDMTLERQPDQKGDPREDRHVGQVFRLQNVLVPPGSLTAAVPLAFESLYLISYIDSHGLGRPVPRRIRRGVSILAP